MAQLDLVNYYGQLVTVGVVFTVLLWFVSTVVRKSVYTDVGLWSLVPAAALALSAQYKTMVTTRSTRFSKVFATLTLGVVDILSGFTTRAIKVLSILPVSTWALSIASYINKSSKLMIRMLIALVLNKSRKRVKRYKSAKLKRKALFKRGKSIKAVSKIVVKKVGKSAKSKKKSVVKTAVGATPTLMAPARVSLKDAITSVVKSVFVKPVTPTPVKPVTTVASVKPVKSVKTTKPVKAVASVKSSQAADKAAPKQLNVTKPTADKASAKQVKAVKSHKVAKSSVTPVTKAPVEPKAPKGKATAKAAAKAK